MQQKESLTATQVLLGMLAYLIGNKFVSEPGKLQDTFYQAHRNYTILRKYFVFQPTTVRHHSRALEQAVEELQKNGVIEFAQHPNDEQKKDPFVFTLTAQGRDLADQCLENFNRHERSELRHFSEIFERECGVSETLQAAA